MPFIIVKIAGCILARSRWKSGRLRALALRSGAEMGIATSPRLSRDTRTLHDFDSYLRDVGVVATLAVVSTH